MGICVVPFTPDQCERANSPSSIRARSVLHRCWSCTEIYTSQCENSAPPSKSRLKLVWNNITIHLDEHHLASRNMYAHNFNTILCNSIYRTTTCELLNLNQHQFFLGEFPDPFHHHLEWPNPAVWPQPTTINPKNPQRFSMNGRVWRTCITQRYLFWGDPQNVSPCLKGKNRIL